MQQSSKIPVVLEFDAVTSHRQIQTNAQHNKRMQSDHPMRYAIRVTAEDRRYAP